MPIVVLILLVFALVFFVIAAMLHPEPHPDRWRLIAAGLACWVLAQLLEAVPGALK